MLVLMDLPQVGVENMGVAGEVGGFLDPSMVGYLLDLTGYTLRGIITLTAVVEVMLIFALLLKERRRTDTNESCKWNSSPHHSQA